MSARDADVRQALRDLYAAWNDPVEGLDVDRFLDEVLVTVRRSGALEPCEKPRGGRCAIGAAEKLIARFDLLRNSGVCSPTTRSLLDEAERLLREGVTPEPAWEYMGDGPSTRHFSDMPERAAEWLRRGMRVRRRTKPVMAGPWTPVEEL